MAGKRSKKPQYAKAFALFCDGKQLGQIATETGLSVQQLAACVETQNWERRRSLVAGVDAVKAAETRLACSARVDSTLVNATETAANTLAEAYVTLIRAASALPIEPFADEQPDKLTEAERDRAHRRLIRDKTEVMKLATSGLRELIETAQNVGLLKVESGDGRKGHGNDRENDKPIDLSKLTQLRIAIGNAAGGGVVVAELSAPSATQGDLRNVTPIVEGAKSST